MTRLYILSKRLVAVTATISIAGVSTLGTMGIAPQIAQAATFDANNLISDSAFTSSDALSEAGIQAFLVAQGSVLKDYSTNGKTAAKIIYEAAHGISSAGNGLTPSISPYVLLATLQKEQSLITTTSYDTAADPSLKIKWAMGYGCPDSGGCNAKYAGFEAQVSNAAWQFQYNYNKSTEGVSYQVGQEYTFTNADGGTSKVKIANRATAALYTYTPHVYNGNYNFWFYFNKWSEAMKATIVGQSPYVTLGYHQGATLTVKVRNDGWSPWQNYGANPVHLGLANPTGRNSLFKDGWMADNRPVGFSQGVVYPGQEAEFKFNIKVPQDTAPGIYKEYFNLVAENYGWFGNDSLMYWEVNVKNPFKSEVLWQSPYPTIKAGETAVLSVALKNTGASSWQNYGPQPVYLATDQPLLRKSLFRREDLWYSATMPVSFGSNVAQLGETAIFQFKVTAPSDMEKKTYRESFRPYALNYGSFPPDTTLFWDITVN